MAQQDYQFVDFAVGTVSGGVPSTSGFIDLITNHGLKFPNTSVTNRPFYLTYWNSTDYTDPTDDPNVEIVQCYKRAADRLYIRRGCFATTPTNKNIVGKTYKVAQFFDQSIINRKLFYFKNPSRGSYYFNDLEHGSITTSFDIFAMTGAGTGQILSVVPAEINHPGILHLSSGNSTSTACRIFYTPLSNLQFGQYDMELTYWVKFPSLTGYTGYFYCGFGDSIGSTTFYNQANGLGFLFDVPASRIFAQLRQSSSTIITYPIPMKIQEGNWYELKIKTFTNSFFQIYVNKILFYNSSIALPLNVNVGTVIGASARVSSNNLSVYWDAYELIATFSPERNYLTMNQ